MNQAKKNHRSETTQKITTFHKKFLPNCFFGHVEISLGEKAIFFCKIEVQDKSFKRRHFCPKKPGAFIKKPILKTTVINFGPKFRILEKSLKRIFFTWNVPLESWK